ncbi:MAG: hypothetical protein NTY76_05465, partial [Candidatus Omnitrophica bacterium]|nr:hypothetical protein [Candidatus Omnitrophota bacterium]
MDMNRNAIINKGISVLLISTFITTQAFALSPSLVSDPGINQARSVTVQEEVAGKTKPGAIGNGQALVELFHGNLPPRIDINDEITAQLQDAIKLAVHLNRDKGNLVPAQHEEKVRLAANNLFGLYSNLTNRTYLYSAIARDSEDYLIGFNHYMAGGESSRIGLAIDFINWLYSKYPPETAKLRLAQYIYHECVPENLVAKEGMIVDTTDHKDIYKEVQTKIFGEEEVAALGRDLREFIEAKVKGPVRLAEAQNLPDLLRGIKESVRATEGSITITDQARFRKDTVDYLAFTAALSQNPDARTSAQQLLR